MAANRFAEECVELRPPGPEPGRIHVLAAGQRRHFAGKPVELAWRGRDVHLSAPLLDVADTAEPGHEEPREVPEESQRGGEPGGDFDGPEVKEPGGRPAGKGGHDRLGRPRAERRGVRAFEETEPPRGRHREGQPSLDEGLAPRVTRHDDDGARSAAQWRSRRQGHAETAFRDEGACSLLNVTNR